MFPRAMPPPDHDPVRDDDDSFEEGEEEDAAALETEADVTCPHCGETMTITLDPGGGRAQEVRRGLPGVLPPVAGAAVVRRHRSRGRAAAPRRVAAPPAAVADPLYGHRAG